MYKLLQFKQVKKYMQRVKLVVLALCHCTCKSTSCLINSLSWSTDLESIKLDCFIIKKRQLLIHLDTVVVRLVSPMRFGAASTPSSGTFVFKLVSKHTISCHASSACLLANSKKEVPEDGVEVAQKRVELTNLAATVFKCNNVVFINYNLQ